MKQYLLKSFAAVAMVMGTTVTAQADNVVYGLMQSYTDGAQTTSVDLDQVNASTTTTVAPSGFAFAAAQEIKCGVTAGDKYYAFVTTMDEDYNEKVALATINFTTGTTVIVNDFSYNYGKPGYNVSGIAYDKNSGVLYATEVGFNNDNQYVTDLFTVDQTNGSMTKVSTFDGQYQAITSDGNGGFYLIQNVQDNMKVYANLYKATTDGTVAPAVENTTTVTGWSSNNSMVASEDGKTVYLITGKSVVEFDVDAKTVTEKGKLSDLIYAASYGKSSEDGTPATPPAQEKKQTRFLTTYEIFGSSMGDIPNSVASKREHYYYNTDGKLVGSANTGREYGEYGGYTDTFTPVDITKYTFNDLGNITNKDTYQWGAYDFDDFAWKKTYNSESYEYNEDGKLAKEIRSNEYDVYSYNEDGTVATKETYAKRSGALLQTITYDSYDNNGNAWHYTSDGAYDSYKYQADVAYDEDGNKVEEYQYTVGEDPDFPGEQVNIGKQVEEWTYEDGILRLYEKKPFNEDGEAVDGEKTVYTPVDGNNNVIAAADSIYSNGKWYENGRPKRYYYSDFSDMQEMTAMDIMAQANPDLANTVDLAFSVPQLAFTQDCKMVIYRDCLPIDSVGLFDVYDDNSGMCIYQDKNLKNGTYTYFVQPLFSTSSEGPLSADGESEEREWTGYFSTNPIEVSVHTDLPAVTDLKLEGGKVEKTGSFVAVQKTYYANLSWKNPEDADKYGFVKNSIYFTDAAVAELDTTNIAATNATVQLYGDDVKAYIVTKYQLGKAISDTIDVKIKDIENYATGIAPVSMSGAVKATFAANMLTLSQNANVTVFAADGKKVYAENRVNSVNLGNLSPATYIVCVEKNGKVDAYKYHVK